MPPPFDREKPGNLLETSRVVWPLALAMAAGTINHFCDRLFLAHVGDAALEAILPADMMSQIVTSTLGTIIGYSATFVAQAHGGGRPHQAVRSFAQGLWLTLMSIPLFIAAVPLGRFLVGLAGHAEEIRAAETAYFSIVAPGGFLNVLNIVLAGILTGQGRTRHVGFSSVAGCVLNLALNPLLIFGLGCVPALGISGCPSSFSSPPIRAPSICSGSRRSTWASPPCCSFAAGAAVAGGRFASRSNS